MFPIHLFLQFLFVDLHLILLSFTQYYYENLIFTTELFRRIHSKVLQNYL